jgi:thiosulfate/3-mercaptopyruvate sulfurtransferase
MDLLISARDLSDALAGDRPIRVLDVRWDLGKPDGRPAYLEGHLPGAVFVDLNTELSTPGRPEEGRTPMPSLATLQAAARRWGIDDGDAVVAYDDAGGVVAGRAVWLLRHAGLGDVRLLDGGLAAWRAEGLGLEAGDVAPEPGGISLSTGGVEILDVSEVGGFAERGVLLDARPADKYTGEGETMEPRGGHIPGAVSAPASANFGADGRFRSLDELAAHYAALGVTKDRPVGVYCGGGTSCSADFIALTALGYDVAVYPGSWSQYAAHPELPVATGPDPRGA